MESSYIQNLFAERIGGAGFGKGTVLYKFEKIKRAKRRAQQENPGVELIDLGVGAKDSWRLRSKLQPNISRKEGRAWGESSLSAGGLDPSVGFPEPADGNLCRRLCFAGERTRSRRQGKKKAHSLSCEP